MELRSQIYLLIHNTFVKRAPEPVRTWSEKKISEDSSLPRVAPYLLVVTNISKNCSGFLFRVKQSETLKKGLYDPSASRKLFTILHRVTF